MTRQLIRNAMIVTGDGRTPPYPGDALIDGDVIAALGAVSVTEAQTADRVIDAGGRALSPGFVDTHNHGALGGTALSESGLPIACELAILGGVTKRICGVDGLSPAPVAEAQRSQYAAQLKPLDGAIEGTWTWTSVAEFLAWHRGRSVTDMGLYLGHSAVRRVVMANVARVASDAEIGAMAEVVRREAPLTLGLSTGLVYNPAVYSDEREIAALVRAFNGVKPGALFPHLRSESDNIIASAKEVIGAAVEGGGGYCNEHSKIAGAQNYDRIGELEGLLADAASLVPTMENMYPYTAGSTTGDAIFPPEMRAGGRAEFLAALEDPAMRAAMIAKMRFEFEKLGQFHSFLRRPRRHPDRRRQARRRRRLSRPPPRRRRARRRLRRSRQRRGLRRRVRLLRGERRRDRDHLALWQRRDDGALLPPPDHGDLHRWVDAGAGTEAAPALARIVSEGVAHGARDGHPARRDGLAHGDAALPLPQPARPDAPRRRRRVADAVRPGDGSRAQRLLEP